MATVKLKAPNGATVSVDSGRVDNLLRRGFSKPSESTKAAPKKASPSKSSK